MDKQNQNVVGHLLRMGHRSPTVSRFVRDYLRRLAPLARGDAPLGGELAPGDRIAVDGALVQQHYFCDALEELNQFFVSVQRTHDASKPIPALALLMLLAANSCAAPLRGYWQNSMLAGTLTLRTILISSLDPNFSPTSSDREKDISRVLGLRVARGKKQKHLMSSWLVFRAFGKPWRYSRMILLFLPIKRNLLKHSPDAKCASLQKKMWLSSSLFTPGDDGRDN